MADEPTQARELVVAAIAQLRCATHYSPPPEWLAFADAFTHGQESIDLERAAHEAVYQTLQALTDHSAPAYMGAEAARLTIVASTMLRANPAFAVCVAESACRMAPCAGSA